MDDLSHTTMDFPLFIHAATPGSIATFTHVNANHSNKQQKQTNVDLHGRKCYWALKSLQDGPCLWKDMTTSNKLCIQVFHQSSAVGLVASFWKRLLSNGHNVLLSRTTQTYMCLLHDRVVCNWTRLPRSDPCTQCTQFTQAGNVISEHFRHRLHVWQWLKCKSHFPFFSNRKDIRRANKRKHV